MDSLGTFAGFTMRLKLRDCPGFRQFGLILQPNFIDNF
jgi:hypothetical protein